MYQSSAVKVNYHLNLSQLLCTVVPYNVLYRRWTSAQGSCAIALSSQQNTSKLTDCITSCFCPLKSVYPSTSSPKTLSFYFDHKIRLDQYLLNIFLVWFYYLLKCFERSTRMIVIRMLDIVTHPALRKDDVEDNTPTWWRRYSSNKLTLAMK